VTLGSGWWYGSWWTWASKRNRRANIDTERMHTRSIHACGEQQGSKLTWRAAGQDRTCTPTACTRGTGSAGKRTAGVSAPAKRRTTYFPYGARFARARSSARHGLRHWAVGHGPGAIRLQESNRSTRSVWVQGLSCPVGLKDAPCPPGCLRVAALPGARRCPVRCIVTAYRARLDFLSRECELESGIASVSAPGWTLFRGLGAVPGVCVRPTV
jgi:hypothetical protein